MRLCVLLGMLLVFLSSCRSLASQKLLLSLLYSTCIVYRIIDWLQSLKQFFFNLILCLGVSLIYILIASLILMAPF